MAFIGRLISDLKNEGQRKGSERERGGKQKKDRTQTDREPGQQKIKNK